MRPYQKQQPGLSNEQVAQAKGPGVMVPSLSCVSGYFITILLSQMGATSERFSVRSSRSRQVAPVGERAELSCQLFPQRSAEHMQVGWYRDHYQPLYVRSKERELSGKSSQNYTNHTVLLKDALRDGKMTLRIHNTSVFDEGQYHCFFKDGDASEEAVVDLKVAAVGAGIQINVQASDTEGLMVECNSSGWFPQAKMEWRDSRGNVIPASSKIFSENGDGLLHLRMSVLLKNSTHGPVTCCFINLVSGQEKRASIVLPDIMLTSEYTSKGINIHLCLLAYLFIFHFLLHMRLQVTKGNKSILRKLLQCLPFLIYAGIFPTYWKVYNRISILDGLAPFYGTWMWDMCLILGMLMAFFTVLIFGLLVTLKNAL